GVLEALHLHEPSLAHRRAAELVRTVRVAQHDALVPFDEHARFVAFEVRWRFDCRVGDELEPTPFFGQLFDQPTRKEEPIPERGRRRVVIDYVIKNTVFDVTGVAVVRHDGACGLLKWLPRPNQLAVETVEQRTSFKLGT